MFLIGHIWAMSIYGYGGGENMFPVMNFQSRDLKSKQDKILSILVHLLEKRYYGFLGPASIVLLTFVNSGILPGLHVWSCNIKSINVILPGDGVGVTTLNACLILNRSTRLEAF